MLIDDDLLDAAADAYLSIKNQIKSLSMTFEDAVHICHTRETKYVLQTELLKMADQNYSKRRIRNGYEYGNRYMNQGVRPAVYRFGGALQCK